MDCYCEKERSDDEAISCVKADRHVGPIVQHRDYSQGHTIYSLRSFYAFNTYYT